MAEAAYRLSIANNVTWGFGTAATLSSEAYMHLYGGSGQWARNLGQMLVLWARTMYEAGC